MMSKEWGYDDTNGPSTWPLRFPSAAGSRQSPVNIVTSQVSSDKSLTDAPLKWNYLPDNCVRITNTGYGWRIDVDGTGPNVAELSGGPLHHNYKLEQFHCHWGRTSCKGSEHTVDGKPYAGELHFVHWNHGKYKTFAEAAAHPDGLAVIGIFLEVGPTDHPEIDKIVSLIPKITYRDQSTEVTEAINPGYILPKDNSYWTYLGSLTTPPCSESVIWILFKQPIKVSEKQLDWFRSLSSSHQEHVISDTHGKVLENYRPPLPLGNRVLRECACV